MLFDEMLDAFKTSDFRSAADALNKPIPDHATETDFQQTAMQLKAEIPLLWKRVLLARNGVLAAQKRSGPEIFLLPVSLILGNTMAKRAIANRQGVQYSAAWIQIAMNQECGEDVLLDTSKVTAEGDAPVLQTNHETSEAKERWKGIPEFLEYVLTAQENYFSPEEIEKVLIDDGARNFEVCKLAVRRFIDGIKFEDIEEELIEKRIANPYLLVLLVLNAITTLSEIRAGKQEAAEEFIEDSVHGNLEKLLNIVMEMYEGHSIDANALNT